MPAPTCLKVPGGAFVLPLPLHPQHVTVSSPFTAQRCSLPALTCLTAPAGALLICPALFEPQHVSVSSVLMAHAK